MALKWHSILWIGLLAFIGALPATAQGLITGALVGHDGQPLLRGDVQILSNASHFPRPEIKRFAVASDGSYEVRVEPPGLFRLRFSGLYHQHLEVPIYLAEADTVILDVQLGTYAYERDSLRVYYRRGDKRARQTVTEKDQQGHFVVPLPAESDTVAYWLHGEGERRARWVNGSVADYFVLGREGTYGAVLYTHGDSLLTITIDAALLPAEASTTTYQP